MVQTPWRGHCDQHGRAEGIAVLGEQRVGDLLDAGIDRAHDRDAAHHARRPSPAGACRRSCWRRRRPPAGWPASAARRGRGPVCSMQPAAASASGSSHSVWSSVPMIQFSTPQRDGQRHDDQQAGQAAICAGRAWRPGVSQLRGAARAPVPAQAGAAARRRAPARLRLGAAWRRRRRLARHRRRPACRLGSRRLLASAVAEIGHVPARALELEAGGGQLLAERARRRRPGTSVSGASDIFCSTSLAWPQALHL